MITLVIADDEEPARKKMTGLLAREKDFEVLGEAPDGQRAVELIREKSPDAVFLDIQMPVLDGFGVIKEIGADAMPAIVFVTAYDEHALQAFEVNALDYLLKPYAPSRFVRVLEKLRRQVEAGRAADLAVRIERALAVTAPQVPQYVKQILVERSPNREVLLAIDNIDLFRAEGNYVRVFANGLEFTRRMPLWQLEERLDPAHFMRISRSEIVRVEAIQEMQPWFHGDYRIIMKDGKTLMWSRRYRAQVKGKL